MVLENGILNVMNLLKGDPAGRKFTKLVVGTGSTPVTGSEVALTNQLAKDVLTINILPSGYIQFNSELTANDPAMIVQEMGLLNENGVLCYRQVITPLNKVFGVTYSINYKIRIQ